MFTMIGLGIVNYIIVNCKQLELIAMKYKRDEHNNLLLTQDQAAELYRLWFNEFLTVSAFASYLYTSDDDASRIIDRGRIVHESNFDRSDNYYE